jgi:Beta-lactamase superfamily domain
MSLTVKHLNADASFLLIFSPEVKPSASDLRSANGAYSILIDPWLTGKSIVAKPWFACTTHNVAPCIQHLSEIDEPDVVVVSQNKPDHCHGETLRQLRPEGKTIIAAEPGAAKVIKKWKHFDPHWVIGLPKYNPKQKFTSLRLSLPPLSPSGHPGEVVISFIPAKNYASGLHNAIGITYQPPTHVKTLVTVSTVDLPRRTPYFHMPLSPASLPPRSPPPPLSPVQRHSVATFNGDLRSPISERPKTAGLGVSQPLLRSSRNGSSDLFPFQQMPVVHSPSSPCLPTDENLTFPAFSSSGTIPKPSGDVPVIHEPEPELKPFSFALPTPPSSPKSSPSVSLSYHHAPSSSSVSQQSSIASLGSTVTPGRPRPVSVLFTPHGLPFSPDLLPYTQNHLVKLGALPLTLLLHSFDHSQNPWYLGGNIMMGSNGGVEIARGLMARCWVSAHDEPKDNRGLAVAKLVVTKTTPEEVRRKLWKGPEGELLRKKGWTCDVRNLGVGAEMFIGPARDLLSGMEGKRESGLLRFS